MRAFRGSVWSSDGEFRYYSGFLSMIGAQWSRFPRRSTCPGRLLAHVEPAPGRIPFQWRQHHHPELELTLTLNSRGLRCVADRKRVRRWRPRTPWFQSAAHVGVARSGRNGGPHVALVLCFDSEWSQRLTAGLVEFQSAVQAADIDDTTRVPRALSARRALKTGADAGPRWFFRLNLNQSRRYHLLAI